MFTSAAPSQRPYVKSESTVQSDVEGFTLDFGSNKNMAH